MSLQTGANPKESITEFGEDLRAKPSCHQYVSVVTSFATDKLKGSLGFKKIRLGVHYMTKLLMCVLLDWVRLKQEDSLHDALWP